MKYSVLKHKHSRANEFIIGALVDCIISRKDTRVLDQRAKRVKSGQMMASLFQYKEFIEAPNI